MDTNTMRLVAISRKIHEGMEQFHYSEVNAALRGVVYALDAGKPRLVFQLWHPAFTRGMPTICTLN